MTVDTWSLKTLAKGLATHVPGLHARLRRGTGGTNSARYCYSVWLRHLVSASSRGLSAMPRRVGELGPGDTLGIGLSALLSGAESYTAFDAVPHASAPHNIEIFDKLVELFMKRSDIPADLPSVKPTLTNYDFPHHILSEKTLEQSLASDRLDYIREALQNPSASTAIKYLAPWHEQADLFSGTVDFLYSQAVLEHVDQIEEAYSAMRQLMAAGGLMSHQIDFRSHGTSKIWNGHLGYSDRLWRTMRGKLPYLLNRRVLSEHLAMQEAAGFRVVALSPYREEGGISRDQLARRFEHITDTDIEISGAHIISTVDV